MNALELLLKVDEAIAGLQRSLVEAVLALDAVDPFFDWFGRRARLRRQCDAMRDLLRQTAAVRAAFVARLGCAR